MAQFFQNYGEKIAALDEYGNKITYDEMFHIMEEIKTVTKSRTLVFSLCTNTIGSLLGYFCFLNSRIVPLLVSGSLDDKLLNSLIETYQPSYLWIPEEKKSMFRECSQIYSAYGYVLLQTNCSPYPMYEELGLLLTTSGSTGSPKLVKQSYKNIESNTKSIVEYLKLTDEERPITTLPMNYTYGLSVINTHLYVGATILLTEKTLMQKDFWTFFEQEKATSLAGVPYTYEILNKLRIFRMDLPSLTTMTQAGGKLSPELHKKFAEYALETGRKFIVMYGQTEATARMAYLPAEKSLEKYGSMGIAIPGGTFELIDINGDIINTHNVVGELIYTGDNVTLGYAQKGDDLIIGDERNGRLATGDMALMDEDGYYYIVGRKKRFLKIFGNRVNLDEIEQLICSKFQSIECVCGGKDDRLMIYIVKNECSDAELDNVKKYISLKTGLNPSAFKTAFISEIPKSDSGKTLYNKLEEYVI